MADKNTDFCPQISKWRTVKIFKIKSDKNRAEYILNQMFETWRVFVAKVYRVTHHLITGCTGAMSNDIVLLRFACFYGAFSRPSRALFKQGNLKPKTEIDIFLNKNKVIYSFIFHVR